MTLNFVFAADLNSYRFSPSIHDARTGSNATDKSIHSIQEKVRMEGRNEKRRGKENKRRRKKSRKERNTSRNLANCRLLC
jgi:hypothetical protein